MLMIGVREGILGKWLIYINLVYVSSDFFEGNLDMINFDFMMMWLNFSMKVIYSWWYSLV